VQYKINGNGPLLLYLPGLDGTGELFYRQIDDLARNFAVVTFGLRTEGSFTYKDLVEDLAALIDRLGFGRALICGESFGGTLALQFALARPDMLDRLVIINSFSYFRNRVLLNAGRILIDLLPNELLHLGRTAAAKLRFIAEDLAEEDLGKFISITSSVPKLAIMQRMALVAGHDVRGRLGEINCPTLLIASRRDRLQNSVVEAELMATLMPSARIRIVEDVGHILTPSHKFSLSALLAEAGFLPQ
jgi:pimeloyl-ACP methyl ester carboxylesterase